MATTAAASKTIIALIGLRYFMVMVLKHTKAGFTPAQLCLVIF